MHCNTNRMLLTVTRNYEILSLVFKAELHMSLFMQTQAQMGEGANHLENNVKAVFFRSIEPTTSLLIPNAERPVPGYHVPLCGFYTGS